MGKYKCTWRGANSPIKVRKMVRKDIPTSIKYLEEYLSALEEKVKKYGIEKIEDGISVKHGGVELRRSVYGDLLQQIKEEGVPKRNGVPACVTEDGHIVTRYGSIIFWDDGDLRDW